MTGKCQKSLIKLQIIMLTFENCYPHIIDLETLRHTAEIYKGVCYLSAERLQFLVVAKCVVRDPGMG